MTHFTVIGNACTDLIATVNDEFLDRYGLRKSHCTHLDSADHLHEIKEELEYWQTAGGGAGANTAHVLAALGADVTFLSRIAPDEEGRSFEKELQQAGVKTVLHDTPDEPEQGLPSPQVLCLITPDGDRSFASYDGVAARFERGHLHEQHLSVTDILYIDGYSFCSDRIADAYIEIIPKILARGGHVCLNVGDRSLIETKRGTVTSVLSACNGFICNRAEAEELYGDHSTENLAKLLAENFTFGALTDGANGAWVFDNGTHARIAAPDISHLSEIDSIGAGDHFAAGILYGFGHGLTPERSGELASLCALDCLSHSGGRPLTGQDDGLKNLKHLIERQKL